MATTGRVAKDARNVKGVEKKTHTTWWKNAQTVSKTTQDFSRSCDIHKRKREILEVMYKQNVTFLEARRIVGSYMRENSYASVVQRVNPIRNSNQQDHYRALVKKWIQLEWNDWLRFQEQLKNLQWQYTVGRPPLSQPPKPLIAIRSSSGFSHLWLGVFHISLQTHKTQYTQPRGWKKREQTNMDLG